MSLLEVTGVKKVYIPKANVPDLEEIDAVVKEAIEFVPCEYFTEVVSDATIEPIVVKDKENIIFTENSNKRTAVRQ